MPEPSINPAANAANQAANPAANQTTVADVVAALEAAYPPHLAESWDAVGLICGGVLAMTSKPSVLMPPISWSARMAPMSAA